MLRRRRPPHVAGVALRRSASTTVLSEAALRPARWRASSCRPKLGGALKASHPPPRPRVRSACASAGPSVDGAGRASTCRLRHPHARPVRAALARLRQRRRLEVDESRKRNAQTGGMCILELVHFLYPPSTRARRHREATSPGPAPSRLRQIGLAGGAQLCQFRSARPTPRAARSCASHAVARSRWQTNDGSPSTGAWPGRNVDF